MCFSVDVCVPRVLRVVAREPSHCAHAFNEQLTFVTRTVWYLGVNIQLYPCAYTYVVCGVYVCVMCVSPLRLCAIHWLHLKRKKKIKTAFLLIKKQFILPVKFVYCLFSYQYCVSLVELLRCSYLFW